MEPLASVERVSKHIIRVLGLNPGPFTLQGTNTYLIGSQKRRFLVDTGDGQQPEYFQLLQSCLKDTQSKISQILLTHWHADHIGGLSQLLQMPDIVTPDCMVYKHRVKEIDDDQSEIREMLALANRRGCLFDISDAQVFHVQDNLSLQAVYTPGHTQDHVSFVVNGAKQQQQQLGLITGDLILGEGTTIVHDLQQYMASLQNALLLNPSMLLCGHGPIIQGKATNTGQLNSLRVIKEYISHRNKREHQVLAVLQSIQYGLRLDEIARRVYTDIPDNPDIFRAAQNNTRLHLLKLKAEGKVQRHEPGDDGGSIWSIRHD